MASGEDSDAETDAETDSEEVIRPPKSRKDSAPRKDKARGKDNSRKAKEPEPPEEKPEVAPLKKQRSAGLAYAKVTKEEGCALRKVALEDSLFHRGGVDYDTQVEVIDTATTAGDTTFFLVNQLMTGQSGWINANNVALL